MGAALGVWSCNAVLGLDGYRGCLGNECDGGAESACAFALEAGQCCPTAPFGAPVRLAAPINESDDGVLRFAADPRSGATVFGVFNSVRAGGLGRQDIWSTSFDGTTYATPQNLASVNSSSAEYSPTLSADALTLVFDSDRPTGNNIFHLWIATRASTSVDFGAPALMTVNDPNGDDRDPYLVSTPNGLVLYFASERAGTSGFNIFRASQTAGTWSAPTLVGSLQRSNYDSFATVTPDELLVYFQSNLGSPNTIHVATATTPAGFGAPRPVNELNDSLEAQGPAYVTADGCNIWFTRTQANGGGPTAIWFATKSP